MRRGMVGITVVLTLALVGSVALIVHEAAGTPQTPAPAAAGSEADATSAAATSPGTPPGPDASDELARAVAAVERLDSLRATLAASFAGTGVEPDRETFQRVCAPVGQEARRIAGENGWKVEQLAIRYRNPAHEADRKARGVMELMEKRPDLMGLWERSPAKRDPKLRYFRRIEVRPACLACHGAKDRRPEFVEESYPDDRAFGFAPGDLRGVYSVTFPSDAEPSGSRGGDR